MRVPHFCVLGLFSMLSLIFVFCLWKNHLYKFTIEECLSIGEDYKRFLEKNSQNKIKVRNLPIPSKTTTTSTTFSTSSLGSFVDDNEQKFIHSQYQFTDRPNKANISFEDDAIEHCITGNVVCRILKTTNVQLFNFKKLPQSNYDGNLPKENSKERKDSFRKIFYNGAWGGTDVINNFNYTSFSGEGSTLLWSQEITAVLHNLIYRIKSSKPKNYVIRMLDVPCGDMMWMKRFLESRNDINYTGVDVVPELISSHKKNFKNKNWKFYAQDIVDAKSLGFYDIILCRMLMQHLYSGDILRILQLFSDSGSSFLISTTYPTEAINEELNLQQSDNPGRYRKVNLELPPFSLTAPICISRDGPTYNRELNTHYVAVWRLPFFNVIDCLNGYSHFVDIGGAKILYNSCSKKSLP